VSKQLNALMWFLDWVSRAVFICSYLTLEVVVKGVTLIYIGNFTLYLGLWIFCYMTGIENSAAIEYQALINSYCRRRKYCSL